MMRRMRTSSFLLPTAIATLLTGCASTPDPTVTRQPLLANGHGVDHVTILTKDVAAAADEYAKHLGFTVGPLTAHSFGFTSGYIYFGDGSYIELTGIHDPAKIAEVGEGFAIDAGEGVRWVTLHSGSTADTANQLKQRGIAMWGPFELPENSPPGEWRARLVGPEQPAFPGGRLYFVEYNEALRAKRRAEDAENVRAREVHANGAIGLRSIWVAVHDLAAATAKYEAAGFVIGPEIRLDVLESKAREIRTLGGTILMVQMNPRSGDAHDSFAGISIKTESLEPVRTIIEQSHATELRPYQGLYGRSILVPSTLARGASVEFFE